jgi:hypothetical protein
MGAREIVSHGLDRLRHWCRSRAAAADGEQSNQQVLRGLGVLPTLRTSLGTASIGKLRGKIRISLFKKPGANIGEF